MDADKIEKDHRAKLLSISFGIMGRIRESYQDGLFGQNEYDNGIEGICKIKDSSEAMKLDEILSTIKDLASKYGTLKICDLLYLLDLSEFANTNEISFYDTIFRPIAYSLQISKKHIEIDKIEMIDTIMINQKLVPKGVNDAMDFSSFYSLAQGCLIIKTKDITLNIFGCYKIDSAEHYFKSYLHLNDKYNELIISLKRKTDMTFSREYVKYMLLRDFDLFDIEELKTLVKDQYNTTKRLVKLGENELLEELSTCDALKLRRLLTLIIMRSIHSRIIPEIRHVCPGHIFNLAYSSLHELIQQKYQKAMIVQSISIFLGGKGMKRTIHDLTGEGSDANDDGEYDPEKELTLREKVQASNAPESAMSKAMQKLKEMEHSHSGDAKAEKFLEGFVKIPFGAYREEHVFKMRQRLIEKANKLLLKSKIEEIEKITCESHVEQLVNVLNGYQPKPRGSTSLIKFFNKHVKDKREYLVTVRNKLDNAVYGHDDAKEKIEKIVAQWMNGRQEGVILGIQGPPGNGKTSIVKDGIANCLIDKDGSKRPVVFIPLGGLRDGASLIGHGYTYVGSIWGRIIDGLIKSKCMNPIFFFDELDKVSGTTHGQEIISILTHLTDQTQNKEFYDEYFQGIPFDLSRSMFIFTFNDTHKIDRILRDRIQIIETKPLKIPEKVIIARQYLMPKILEEMGLDDQNIKITDESIQCLVEDYTYEAGVRKLKELLFDLVRECNISNVKGNLKYPYLIEKDIMVSFLKRKHPIIHEKISKKPEIGLMNGMYANSYGLGGITKIEVSKTKGKTPFDLELTGSQGDVMKESMKCALTIAWNKLSIEEQESMKKETFGFHIHCPSCSMPKDGPSAGAAITLALLSTLKQKPINNKIAMTGEIELNGKVTQIGGLAEKLIGTKKAGVTLVYVPLENKRDVQDIKRDYPNLFDENFSYKMVDHIDQVIPDVF